MLVLLGADPLADFPDAAWPARRSTGAGAVVALDTFLTDSSALADVVLPAAVFAEKAGTTTNLEGRVTTVAQRVTPPGTARPDWMVAAELADLLGHDDLAATLRRSTSITDAIAATVPAYAAATRAAFADNREGVLAVDRGRRRRRRARRSPAGERNSYDYRLVVARRLYDRAIGDGEVAVARPARRRRRAHVNPVDADRIGAPEDGTGAAHRRRGSVVLPLRRDPRVPAWHRARAVQPRPGINGDRRRSSAPATDVRSTSRSERASSMTLGLLIAVDPLLVGGLKWTPLVHRRRSRSLVIFVVGLVGTMFMVWFERKVIAGMQNRIGPNKAGPFGVLQTLADGMKLIFKEDFLPDRADRFVYRLAPFLAFVPAFLVWSVIPLGGDFSDGNDGIVTWFGHETRVQLADPPIGILFVLALSSIAVYGIMLAGWSSGSKYPLLGSVRASAQMVSYEAALGLSVAAVCSSPGR